MTPMCKRTAAKPARSCKGSATAPERRLAVRVSTRNISPMVDMAVALIDQLKEIYIDGEVEPIDNALWFAKVMRHDYTVAQGATFKSIDDPDQVFYETYTCGAENNPDGYCNPEIDKLIDRQSAEFDEQKRKQLVWEIEQRLAEDGARLIIYHTRAATCRQPYVNGFISMVNSVYNGWRFEDLWLDK